jgi:hypothetical protein
MNIEESIAAMDERCIIEYWVWDTTESGHWEETGLVSLETAQKVLASDIFEQPRLKSTRYYV